MASIHFQFKPEDTKNLHPAYGQIVLGPHAIGKDGLHHLSEDCMSVREVEQAVKYLKRELDKVLKKAKRKFKDSN